MKSMTMNTRWVTWFILGMGLLFIAIGIGAFLFATGFDSVEDEQVFRYVFLGVFGGIGVVEFVVGGAFAYHATKKRRMIDDLVSSGNSIWADVVDVSSNQNVRINRQSPRYLLCAYRHTDGNTYMFKSPYLRYDPRRFLKDGKVKVWFDPYNMKRYYVDVDGSLTENIIEV